MLDYFIARFLFNLNSIISIRRRTTTLETIASLIRRQKENLARKFCDCLLLLSRCYIFVLVYLLHC